jgi:hypothetical protein
VDFSKLSKNDRIVAGGGAVLFIASFLPWFGISILGESATGNGWDVGFLWGGLPALLGLAVAAVVVLRASGTELPTLPVSWPQAILGASALAALLVVLKLLIGHEEVGIDFDREWGLFVAAIAAVALAVGSFLKYQEDGGSSGGSSL